MNPHYAAAKAALLSLSKQLAGALAGDGILVNAISPGNIATEFWDEYVAELARDEGRPVAEVAARENGRVTAQTPLKRLGTPDEVAECVLFLAQGAGFVTGANLVVDGGRVKGV
jgi:3-oxoacyl-[acyl-carrier protein] reductase